MYLRFLTLIGVLIFSSSFVYSSCQSPDYIKFTQNSFSQNITAGGGISFKSNLTIYPIQIDYVYSSNQKCYPSDIITLGDGINVILEPILHSFENNLTTIRFSFSDFFIDEFKVLRLHSNGTRINQDFVINSDDEAPNFDFDVYDSNQNRINSPVKVLENLTFKFTFDDSSSTNPSGISHIELDSQKINLDSSNNYVRGIISTKNFLFTIYDKAGNSRQKSVLIEVDSTEPQVMDFINRGVKIVGSSLYFTYSFTVEDENFNGDLSKINISYSQSSRFSNSNLDRPYQCDYLTTNKYTCYVETLVSFGDTFNTDVIISVADDLSNTNTITFTNKEIYIDSMPPVINEFKFVNSQGFENVIAPRVDSSISLYLSFSDDSDVDIIPDFGYITFPYPGNGPCGSGCYSWNFSTGVGSNFDSYIGLETNYEHFYVKLIDDYGYESIANVTLFFDRYAPEIFDIEVSETDSSFVQDSLIESEEKFDVSFKIYENKAIFGESLDASQIYGNFSLVTEERNLINPTNCEVEDDENSDLLIFECMFENLEAKIGYVNSSFEIFAVDKGGNRGELNFEMEIFARTSGDDPTQNRYEIKDITGGNNLKVIAPISRSMLEEGYADVTAWYNGKIIDYY